MGLHRASDSRPTGSTILVVDDDAVQRASVSDLLSTRGYAVVVACDGQEAVELLESGLRPRVIVLDLNMPRMDGWAFLRHLRGAAHSSVPVLVTSAAAREPTPTEADARLEKPLEPEGLRAMVGRLAARRPGRG
jgi:two-component system, chemotaxis family, chemotaxis protein CheY